MKLAVGLVAGTLAGAAGTAALDALQYRRYRRGDGKEGFWRWELASDVMSWDQASAPGQVARKAWHRVTGEDPPESWARPATNLVHWATGIGWGAAYGALASMSSHHPLARALALGPTAWIQGYIVLPLAKVYKPIWEYDAKTLADDLSAHVVYGDVVSLVFWALTGRNNSQHRAPAALAS
jgi:hypothetical protein